MHSNTANASPDARAESPRIFSVGALALAGLFGGPLAIAYAIDRDLRALELSDRLRLCAFWFVPLIALWLYFIFSTPPDLISQLIPFLPETILWWMVASHCLAPIHADYRCKGGQFRSRWAAVRLGLLTFVALKIVFFAGGLAYEM